MNATKAIKDCLAARHAKDRLIFECKNGPTHGANHLRLDAWAMKTSWSQPTTYGYEIKVSRQDFLRDEKWQAYLGYCSDFYFVCPRALIQPEELPAEVGLLWLSNSGTRLFTKRRAVRRDITIPEELWRYIIMCRAQIGPEQAAETRPEFWRRWLSARSENRALGYEVSKAIRSKVEAVERENMRLLSRMDEYDDIRARIAELGFDPGAHVATWAVRRRLSEAAGLEASTLSARLRQARESMDKLIALAEMTAAREAA